MRDLASERGVNARVAVVWLVDERRTVESDMPIAVFTIRYEQREQ
jgi:hypothetical protein